MANGSGSGGRGSSGGQRGAGTSARATFNLLSERLGAGGLKKGERKVLERRLEIAAKEIFGAG